MLIPKKTKYKYYQKGRIKGFSSNCLILINGDFGLKCNQKSQINSKQIESCRKLISKNIKGLGKLWIRIFPYKPLSFKSPETRMGKGKGDIKFYVFNLKPGRIIFEIKGIKLDEAKHIFRKVSYKLPFKTNFIFKC